MDFFGWLNYRFLFTYSIHVFFKSLHNLFFMFIESYIQRKE